MKTKILITATFLFINYANMPAQSRITKETKVVLVVNEKTNGVTNIAEYAEIQRLMKRRSTVDLKKKYPRSKFYIGLLKGSYTSSKAGLTPGRGAVVTMYTNKQLFPGDQFFPGDNFFPGDQFKLGSVSSKVIVSKKGVLTVKTM